MIKILLSIYLLLSSFVLFAQGLFENDPIWRDEFNRDNVPSSMYWSYIVGMRGQESELEGMIFFSFSHFDSF